MKVLFLAAGPITWGSSRMRCYWPAEAMGADVLIWDGVNSVEVSLDYDVYIIQKHVAPDTQKYLRDQGKKVFLDQCDPMWWFSDQKLLKAGFDNCDGVAFSSKALENDFLKWYHPVIKTTTIEDRLKLDHFPKRRKHIDTSPVRFIWYGVSVNRVALAGAWANLSRLRTMGYNVTLTLFDDAPTKPLGWGDDVPVLQATWNLKHENAMLAGYDIALLPPYPGPWGKVKSNNKAKTAHACGLPVTDGLIYEGLVLLMDKTTRELRWKSQSYLKCEGVEKSAQEWEAFIA